MGSGEHSKPQDRITRVHCWHNEDWMKQRFSLGEQRLGTRLILRVNPKTKQIDVQSGEGICRYYINEKRKSVENDFSAGKLFVIPRLFTKKSFLNFNKYNFSERYGMHKAQ